jgi:hypothetical protein
MRSSDQSPPTTDFKNLHIGDPLDGVIALFETPFFMTEEYERQRQRRRPKLADGTLFAGISPDTAKVLHTLPRDESPHPVDFCLIRGTDIEEVARNARDCGYTDWRIPSPTELQLMHRDREEIRGFGSEWYWTSSETSPSTRVAIRFPDGLMHPDYLVNAKARLRLVRDNGEIMFPRKDGNNIS